MPILPKQRRNLILVSQPSYLSTADLFLISDKIRILAPDVKTIIVGNDDRSELIAPDFWKHPCLTVSFGTLKKFHPLRGPVFLNQQIPKLEQSVSLTNANVRTPKTEAFKFEMKFDEREWSKFVILKPASLDQTSSGKNLCIYRTEKINLLTEASLPSNHPLRGCAMIAQQFIDSGPRFKVYRCLTLFGQCLYQNLTESVTEHMPLDSPDAVLESIHPEPERNLAEPRINVEPDVIEFAKKVATVFPTIPLLGCDIVREFETGNLFAIEVNAGGNVWHFSSPRNAHWRSVDKVMQYVKTFGSFDRAAESLVRTVRRYAT